MKTLPIISVIVPVYKVEQFIRNCIDSVQAQTYMNWEMILVDDGSPDQSGEICDEYAKIDDRIKVLHKENRGLSSARNAALDLPPKGEFVTFLDSDDFWHKDYLKNMIGLQQSYNVDIVQCDFVRGTATTFPGSHNKVRVDVFDNHGIFLLEKSNVIMCGKLYRTSLFDGVRMPVGLYNEDDWTAWKLYYKAKTIVVTNQQLYYYTVNPYSTMAKLKKKPDLRYINAYNERISFFVQTREKDLEHCSRLQLCKSLVLIYRNKQLSNEERTQLKEKFEESWKVLKLSPYINIKYKVIFYLFHIMPLFASNTAAKLHSKK